MSHPVPGHDYETDNPDLPEDYGKDDTEPVDGEEKLVIRGMSLMALIAAQTNILAWLTKLPPRESIAFTGATGTPDSRLAF